MDLIIWTDTALTPPTGPTTASRQTLHRKRRLCWNRNRAAGGGKNFTSRPTHWCYTYCPHVAVVEVNEGTGEVKVLTVIAAHDVGKIINSGAVKDQVEGGVMMGVGYALSEQYLPERGINLTDNLLKCGLPTADRAPEILPVLVEIPHPEGPLELKGLAEGPSLPTAPAICNAIFDEVGVRICDLPAVPERVN